MNKKVRSVRSLFDFGAPNRQGYLNCLELIATLAGVEAVDSGKMI